MEEERDPWKDYPKSVNRNKRSRSRSSDTLETSGDDESENQNQPPPEKEHFKRLRAHDGGAGPSNRTDPHAKKEQSEATETPASFVSPTAAPVPPGAPRILLINQQANADLPLPAQSPINTRNHYLQLMRTPPSTVRNSKLHLRKDENEEYRGYDPFDRVSDEIILRVLHLLPRHMMCTCALVCRRWARIVCDMSLWRRMDMGGRPVRAGVLKILLERGVEVLRLNRSEIMGDFSSTVQGAPDPRRSPLSEDRMYRLQLLDMSMANVKTSMVESMLRFCPNLRKISLENIPVTEQLLFHLAVNSPYLEVLNLCMCVGVSARGLRPILQNCSSLSSLNIAWTCMSQQDITTIFSMLPSQLIALDISGNREKIQDSDISALCQACPQMQDLDLSDSTEITNDCVEEIGNSLGQLRKLSLSRCYSLTPGSLLNLTKLPHLQTINVYGMMRETSLSVLEQHLKQFRLNKEPFSRIARPTTSNCRKVYVWNVSPQQTSL